MLLTPSFQSLFSSTLLLLTSFQSIQAQPHSSFQPRQQDVRLEGPIATGGIYNDGFEKARKLIDTMTLEEKLVERGGKRFQGGETASAPV